MTGRRVLGVRPVGTNNASGLPSLYEGVTAQVHVDDNGRSTRSPKSLPEDQSQTLHPFPIRCETVLIDIIGRRGFVFGNHVLHDPDLNILFAGDVSPEGVLFSREFLTRHIRPVSGTVAYLSNTWIDNYYHWMQLTLPLIRLYRALAPDLTIDYYYVGQSRLAALQVETLALCGVKPEQIIREACTADRMICAITSHPAQHGVRYRDQWGHGFVRSLVKMDRSRTSPKRIFVRRGSTRVRNLVNEREVIAQLVEYGFTPVSMDNLSCREQAELFHNAEIIAGVHGAALTNIVFARHAKIIEIFSKEQQPADMFVAATYCDLDYYFVFADTVPQRDNLFLDHSKLDRLMLLAGVDRRPADLTVA